MDLFVFTFHDDGRVYRALSPLSPEEVEQRGLPTEAVLGEISALLPSMTPDQFEQNEAFVDFVHALLQAEATAVPHYLSQAAAQGTGSLTIVDGRVAANQPVDMEDILGTFQIRRGELLPESYEPNPAYRVLTDKGPIKLPDLLEGVLIQRLRTLNPTR